jgi:TolA-binding protein
LADRPAEALACYRRFLTEKPLIKSKYAPGALLRAGVLCDGDLRDRKTAMTFYQETIARDESCFSGQTARLYLADSLALSGKKSEAMAEYTAYLKKFPSGDFAEAIRARLLKIKSNSAKK